MRRHYWICWSLGIVAMATGASGADIKVDFEGKFRPLKTVGGKPSRIVGKIAPLFGENSSGWADVDAEFSRLTEDPFKGKASMRIKVNAIRKGRMQVWIPQLKLPAGKYIRLQLALRAPGSGALDLAIRTQGAPWTEKWRKSVSLSPEWRVFKLLVPPITGGEHALMMYLSPGVLDIDDFSMVFLAEDELGEGRDPKVGNLLPTSRFPLGLQRPWALDWDHVGARATADSSTPGPSGQPGLKLMPGLTIGTMPRRAGVQLVSPAFEANSLREHTVSFFAKASEPGQPVSVQLGVSGGKRASRSVALSTEWKRHAVTLKLPLLVDGYAVAFISSDATFWIDGVQVEEGKEKGAYKPTGKVELVLGDAVPYNLLLDTDKPEIRLAATGDVKSVAKIEGTISDVYARSAKVVASVGATAIELPFDKVAAYGIYRVELRAYDAAGAPISKWAEAVVHRIRKARFAGCDAPESPFGIHVNAVRDEAAMVKRLGFNWVRVHDAAANLTKWYFLESRPGTFEFEQADRDVDLFRSEKLMILGMVDTAPKWRTNCPTGHHSWSEKYFIPNAAGMDEWEAYCEMVVKRYRGKIRHWEVWNEPYYRNFFGKNFVNGDRTQATSADYVPLFNAACRACRRANPDAIVIWADHRDKWHRGCVEGKVHEICDAASLHAYISPQPYGFPDFARRLKVLREGVQRSLRYWNTEGGMGGANLQDWLRRTPPYDKEQYTRLVAEYLVRYQIASLVAGVKRFFLYTYHKWCWHADWNVRLPDGALPPNASAQSNAMWHLEGKTFRKTVHINNAFDAHIFTGGGETVAVILKHKAGALTLARPALQPGEIVRDLYGNDVSQGARLDHGVWYLTSSLPMEKVSERVGK